MRRYIVFGGSDPRGGWSDYLGSADTIRQACELPSLAKMPILWWHVVDTLSGLDGEVVMDDVSVGGGAR